MIFAAGDWRAESASETMSPRRDHHAREMAGRVGRDIDDVDHCQPRCALEDKIVQKAVAVVLNAIYDAWSARAAVTLALAPSTEASNSLKAMSSAAGTASVLSAGTGPFGRP
jgi:hypothetical protein